VRRRDPCCLISGLRVVDDNSARFKATHIFPHTHSVDVRLIELVSFWAVNVELCSGLIKVIQVSLPIPLPRTKWVGHQKLIRFRMCSFCDLICMTLGIATSSRSTLTFVISLCWYLDNQPWQWIPTAWPCHYSLCWWLQWHSWKSPQTGSHSRSQSSSSRPTFSWPFSSMCAEEYERYHGPRFGARGYTWWWIGGFVTWSLGQKTVRCWHQLLMQDFPMSQCHVLRVCSVFWRRYYSAHWVWICT
jgi:hypothetical protein